MLNCPLLKIFLTGLGHKNDQFVQRKGQDMHEALNLQNLKKLKGCPQIKSKVPKKEPILQKAQVNRYRYYFQKVPVGTGTKKVIRFCNSVQK